VGAVREAIVSERNAGLLLPPTGISVAARGGATGRAAKQQPCQRMH
jgi:hypothetical protein